MWEVAEWILIDIFLLTSVLNVNWFNAKWRYWRSSKCLQNPLTGGPNAGATSLKSRIRRAFRSTSNPGQDPGRKAFSVISQLTSAALCASSPVLPSNQSLSAAAKSASRPLSVPKVQVNFVGLPPARRLIRNSAINWRLFVSGNPRYIELRRGQLRPLWARNQRQGRNRETGDEEETIAVNEMHSLRHKHGRKGVGEAEDEQGRKWAEAHRENAESKAEKCQENPCE